VLSQAQVVAMLKVFSQQVIRTHVKIAQVDLLKVFPEHVVRAQVDPKF
jgi:hypothetical protein